MSLSQCGQIPAEFWAISPFSHDNDFMRVRFANCVFDSDSHELICDGKLKPLQPKAFAFLEALVEAHPAAVSKEVLYERLWPGVFVEEGNLHNLAADLRRAIGDEDHAVLRTVHRVGYALAASVSREDELLARLIIGSRELPLSLGDTIIGRKLLGTPDVSRRHALLHLDDTTAYIEDLGSKNGTFVGGRRVESRTELASGDEIVFGRTRAVVWLRGSEQTTITAR